MYVVLSGYVYLSQEKFIFFPDKAVSSPPKGLNIEAVRLKTADGETLAGWWMQGEPGNRTVLFFHGNGGSLAGLAYQMEVFRKLGLNALMFDYRGYGESTGRIKGEADLYADAEAAWKFLTVDKGITESRIILWGQSLGGGVAAEVARNKKVDAIILDSSFYSMEEMARGQFPYLPTNLLLKYPLRTDKKLKEFRAPLLVIHSRDDAIIPFGQGEKLFAEALDPKMFLEVTGSHISACFDCEEKYIGGIKKFIDSINNNQTHRS